MAVTRRPRSRRRRITQVLIRPTKSQTWGGTNMETVGFVGIGKIGLPIAENLIKSGYRVLGYRRSSLAEFEKIGGIAGRSSVDVGAQADIVFSCLPSSQALEDVVQGPNGLIKSARPGQIIVELGSYPVRDKERHVAPLAAKGAIF